MARNHRYRINISLDAPHKIKLDMMRTIVQLNMPEGSHISWEDTVWAMLDMIPIPTLYANALKNHNISTEGETDHAGDNDEPDARDDGQSERPDPGEGASTRKIRRKP